MHPASDPRVSPARTALPLLLAPLLAMALLLAPAWAQAKANDDYSLSFEVTLSPDDTYAMKMVLQDRAKDQPRITKETCTVEKLFQSSAQPPKDAKASFTEEGGTRTCTITGSEDISLTNGLITHEEDEYVVKTEGLTGDSAVKMSLSVTFPGAVTQADGGTVEGSTVTLDSVDDHVLRGKDSAGPSWPLVAVGVLAGLTALGALAALVVVLLRRKRAQQP